MARCEITFTVHARLARCVMWALAPAVFLHIITEERASKIVLHFVRLNHNTK